jgi:Arc/MetJ-type ribon-helix-helix transcriptional regulator
MAKVRLNIEISENLADFLDALAESEHTTRSELVRRAIAVLQAFHKQREIGRPHLGFVRDPERLDAEIVGVLQPTTTTALTPTPRIAPVQSAPVLTEGVSPAPVLIFSESSPVSMEAAMSRWSPHGGGR